MLSKCKDNKIFVTNNNAFGKFAILINNLRKIKCIGVNLRHNMQQFRWQLKKFHFNWLSIEFKLFALITKFSSEGIAPDL